MGNTACQQSNGLHLLGLTKFVFQPLPFGHVAGDAQYGRARFTAVGKGLEWHRMRVNPTRVAIQSYDAEFQSTWRPVARPLVHPQEPVSVIRVNEVGDGSLC